MANTHYKILPYTVVPDSTLSNFPRLVKFTADSDIGGRISDPDELRFYTPGDVALDWRDISLTLAAGELSGWAMVVVPSELSSADTADDLLKVEYGGTSPVSGGPDSTLSLSGLVAGYDFEDTGWSDWSGEGNTGTDYNSVTVTDGKVGNAASFNGSTQYVSASNPTTATTDFTLSCWVYWDGETADHQLILYNGNPSANGYGLYIENLGTDVLAILHGGQGWGTRAAPGTGEWHHLAYVRDGSAEYLYLDGSPTTEVLSTPSTPGTSLLIGGRPSSNDCFDGLIDDARVYERAQTTDELAHQVATTNSPGTWGSETEIGGGGSIIPLVHYHRRLIGAA